MVLAILDELDHSTLVTLSLVNKWLHDTVTERLWRSAQLWMPAGLSASEWRRLFVAKCDAFLQNSRRVSCTRSLDVRLDGPVHASLSSVRGPFKSRTVTKFLRVFGEQLTRVLRAMEGLTSLRIHVLSKEHVLHPVIARVLSNSHTAFRFQLAAFECDSCLEVDIYPFLVAQAGLESYSARVAPGLPLPSYSTLSLDLTAEGEHRLAGYLPALRRYEGPAQYVRAMTAGRNLESLVINSSGVFQDLTAQPPPPKTLPPATSAHVLLRVRHMDYLSQSQLPTLLTQTYNLSGPSILHLRIHASIDGGPLPFLHHWQTREVPNRLPARMLASFPNLQSLYIKTPAHPLVKYNLDLSEALGFVSDVPAECGRLRVITLSADVHYEMRTFVRVDGLVTDEERPAGVVLEDHRGPMWVFEGC